MQPQGGAQTLTRGQPRVERYIRVLEDDLALAGAAQPGRPARARSERHRAPRLVGRTSTAPLATATVAGRHCEAGDVLAGEAELPGDIRPGDLLAVPVAGACHLSMASGYNLVGRPPVVAVADGRARLLVRRESLDDIRSREVGL